MIRKELISPILISSLLTGCYAGRGYISRTEGDKPVGIQYKIPLGGESDMLEPISPLQEKELVTRLGIVLAGMTKKEVLAILGYPKTAAAKYWYYELPREVSVNNKIYIYFEDGKVVGWREK